MNVQFYIEISLILFFIKILIFLSAEALVKLSHIRLDRLQISRIENLECLGPVTNLYLQQVNVSAQGRHLLSLPTLIPVKNF